MEDLILDIPVELIEPNPDQPRTEFDEMDLQNLAFSIKEHGLVQAITVRKIPEDHGKFYLIDGERRLRASKLAGLQTIKAYIKESVPECKESLIGAVIANSQRSDLNPIDEARSYEKLIKIGGYTQKKVIELVGKSATYVVMRIKLLELEQEIQVLFAHRKLSTDPGLIYAIASLPKEIRVNTVRRFVQRGISVSSMKRNITKIINSYTSMSAMGLGHSKKAPAVAMGVGLNKLNRDIGDAKEEKRAKILTLLEKSGSIPKWKLVEEAAKKTCEECNLFDLVSLESCKECPAVDLVKHLNKLSQSQ